MWSETGPLFWNEHLDNTLNKHGFSRSAHDPCVYHKHFRDGGVVILAIVVDDILAAASHPGLLTWFAACLRATYTITDLGVPAHMVGLILNCSPTSIRISQTQFVKDLARKFGQTDANPAPTPIAAGDVPDGASPLLPPGHNYLSLAGSLLWVTISRPDVSVAVSIVCSKSVSPTKADWNAALRVLRYLLSTPDRVLTFVPPSPKVPAVAAYVDAAWANAPRSRSRYGLIVCVYGCPVLWITKLTSIVCLSTAEAEYFAAVEASKSALWLARMLAEVLRAAPPTVVLYEDNQACIHMANNPVVSARNRHFAMRMWWLRDQVAAKTIAFRHVPTKHQLADILTKVLPAALFRALCDVLFKGRSLFYSR